jgi:hypothetical protein
LFGADRVRDLAAEKALVAEIEEKEREGRSWTR